MKAEGFSQRPFRLPNSLLERVDRLKHLYNLKSRDAAVALLIQRAMDELKLRDITLPVLPSPGDEIRRVTLNLHQDHLEYLDSISHTLRGVNSSIALEAVIHQVRDLRPVQQLNLEMGIAVSG